MSRFIKIFAVHFQDVFVRRGSAFVWFLLIFTEVAIMLLFWNGAIGNRSIDGWTISNINSYYLLLIVAGSMLISHIDDNIWREDIHGGQLSPYLLRPMSYFWAKLYHETPYRLIQGVYGILLLFILSFFFEGLVKISLSLEQLLLSILIFCAAYFLSHCYKMIVGIIAFWLTDVSGLYELLEIALTIFAGFVIPLHFLPSLVASIAYVLPYAYMAYFPVMAFQGELTTLQLIQVLSVQCLWIGILLIIYKIMWEKGVRMYSGVGQ